MYTANPHHRIEMAKAHREREIRAAADYRLARTARTGDDRRPSGVAAAASATLGLCRRLFDVTKAHAHRT
jgi:hypothetical protein